MLENLTVISDWWKTSIGSNNNCITWFNNLANNNTLIIALLRKGARSTLGIMSGLKENSNQFHTKMRTS